MKIETTREQNAIYLILTKYTLNIQYYSCDFVITKACDYRNHNTSTLSSFFSLCYKITTSNESSPSRTLLKLEIEIFNSLQHSISERQKDM